MGTFLSKRTKSSLSKLSKIDVRTKYAVYGWIREAESDMNMTEGTIPEVIVSICVLYLPEEDEFQIIHESIRLSENKRIIWKSKCVEDWVCNYGKFKIPSLSNSVCQWDLRINKLDVNVSAFVGVSSSIDTTHSDDDNHYLIHDVGYKNEVGSGDWVRYCSR